MDGYVYSYVGEKLCRLELNVLSCLGLEKLAGKMDEPSVWQLYFKCTNTLDELNAFVDVYRNTLLTYFANLDEPKFNEFVDNVEELTYFTEGLWTLLTVGESLEMANEKAYVQTIEWLRNILTRLYHFGCYAHKDMTKEEPNTKNVETVD